MQLLGMILAVVQAVKNPFATRSGTDQVQEVIDQFTDMRDELEEGVGKIEAEIEDTQEEIERRRQQFEEFEREARAEITELDMKRFQGNRLKTGLERLVHADEPVEDGVTVEKEPV